MGCTVLRTRSTVGPESIDATQSMMKSHITTLAFIAVLDDCDESFAAITTTYDYGVSPPLHGVSIR